MARMVEALDLRRGDVVKVLEVHAGNVGTDHKVPVEVTINTFYEGGCKTNVYVEVRSGLDLRIM